MAEIHFGEVEGVLEGDTFISRMEMKDKKVHRNPMQGIDGNGREGSSSIVLNGGYEDDEDNGDIIVYTGHGGNRNGKQVSDQSFENSGNKGLLISEMQGLPVRVTRGYRHKSPYSPVTGYKYGGLYMVTEHWYKVGSHGFGVCLFKLEKVSSLLSNALDEVGSVKSSEKSGETTRTAATILRIVRDTKLSRQVKKLYNYTCQVCQLRIASNGVAYAEAAHIKPLGKPHNGKDLMSNLLCLCPNHHVMFDKGHFSINDDFSLIGIDGDLTIDRKHHIDFENLVYHRQHHQLDILLND